MEACLRSVTGGEILNSLFTFLKKELSEAKGRLEVFRLSTSK